MKNFKIGLRTIKTFIAVLLCYLIDLFRRHGSPFFSLTAAIFCMQKDIESSKKASFNRVIGTVIGGSYGLAVLLLFKYVLKNPDLPVEYLISAAAIVPLIQITVLLKQQSATYISCVVYLSILVTHGGDTDPFLYAYQRVLDTLIGILVSLFVNRIPFLRYKPGKAAAEPLQVSEGEDDEDKGDESGEILDETHMRR